MGKRIDIKNKDRPYRKSSKVCLLQADITLNEVLNKKIKIDSG